MIGNWGFGAEVPASGKVSIVKIDNTDPSLHASGSLGAPVLNALVKSGKVNVTVVKRPSSFASSPDLVTVRTVDLSSADSVIAAFKRQHALVSTVGKASLLGQGIPVEAAVAANVKVLLPSNLGNDMANPKAGVLPVYKFKTAMHKALRKAAAAKPDFTYTPIYNNAF